MSIYPLQKITIASDKYQDVLINLQNNLDRLQRFDGNKTVNLFNHKKRKNFLLIGPNSSGKAELIKSVSDDAIDAYNIKNHTCQSLAFNEHNIFSIPGHLVSNEESLDAWHDILKLFRQRHMHIDGVIIACNLHQLIHFPNVTKAKINLHIQNILQLIKAEQKKSIPVIMVINHFDTILGFNEFFSDASQEDLDNICGSPINKSANSDDLTNNIQQALWQLQNKFEQQLSHKINNIPSKRDLSLAYEFTLQFAASKNYITKTCQQIFANNPKHFPLMGIYFTSCKQTNTKTDALGQYIKNALSSNTKNNQVWLETNCSYFIKQLFSNEIIRLLPNKEQPEPKKIPAKINLAKFKQHLTIVAAIILAYSGYIINKEYSQLYTLHQTLKNTQLQIHQLEKKPDDILAVMQLMSNSTSLQNKYHNFLFVKLLSLLPPYFYNINNQLQNLSSLSKQKFLLPLVQKELEKNLVHSLANKNSAMIYKALRAYLMLSHPNLYAKDYLIAAIMQAFDNNPFIENDQLQFLETTLTQSLDSAPNLAINQALVTKAQQKLYLNPEQIIFANLLNSNTIANTANDIIIPPHFQRQNFIKYFEQLIPNLVQEFKDTMQAVDNSYSFDDSAVIDNLQKRYLQTYANAWHAYIKAILPIVQTSDVKKLVEDLHHFMESLTKHMAIIQKNTAMLVTASPTAKLFNTFVNENILDTMVANDDFQTIIASLSDYLIRLAQSNASNTLIYSMVKDAFTNKVTIFDNLYNTKHSKVILFNQWITDFSQKLWEFHILETKQHIQRAWQKQILPTFTKKIHNKYPLNKKTPSEIHPLDFSNFFAPTGILDRFYVEYIEPFYNTNSINWHLKQKYSSNIPFTPIVATSFIKHQLIKTMFFDGEILNVNFHLTPIKLASSIKAASLSYDSNRITYQQGQGKPVTFSWPAKNNSIAHLLIETTENKHTSFIYSGFWSIYKLLDKATIHDVMPGRYELSFSLNGNIATFDLQMDKAINPLNQVVMDSLHLPKQLFS